MILNSGHMGKTKVKSTRTSSFSSHKYQLFTFFHLPVLFPCDDLEISEEYYLFWPLPSSVLRIWKSDDMQPFIPCA